MIYPVDSVIHRLNNWGLHSNFRPYIRETGGPRARLLGYELLEPGTIHAKKEAGILNDPEK